MRWWAKVDGRQNHLRTVAGGSLSLPELVEALETLNGSLPYPSDESKSAQVTY